MTMRLILLENPVLYHVFIGNDQDPFSINGGFKDQLSNKSISLLVDDIDGSYDYIKVYYTRTTSDVDGNKIVTAQQNK